MRANAIPLVPLLAALVAAASACVRVNCGGGALPGGIMADNREFYAMTASWVAKYSTSRTGVKPTVFDSHSWTNADDLVYAFSPPANATYSVQLHFAENWVGAARPGVRVINVSINGVRVASNLDVFVAAGRQLYTPVSIGRTTTPEAGEIEIRVTRVVGNPFLSGITISRAVAPPAPAKPASGPVTLGGGGDGPMLAKSGAFRTAAVLGAPAARHEACAVTVAGKVYLIGGRGMRPVDMYDPVTRRWTSRKTPDVELNHMQCVAWRNRYIYIADAWFGQWPFEKTHNRTFIYDTTTDAWSTVAGLGARARGAAAFAVYKDKMYLAMGNRGGHGAHATTLAEFDEFDPTTGKWTALPDALDARDHTGGGIVGDRFCVAGGRDGGSADALSSPVLPVNCFNFVTRKWERRASIPEGRAGASTGVTCQGLLMVAGGEGMPVGGMGQVFARVDLYDVAADRFREPVFMKRARHGSGAAIMDCKCGNVYIPSGSGALGDKPELNSTEVWAPDGAVRNC